MAEVAELCGDGKDVEELKQSCEDEIKNYAASKGTIVECAMEVQMYTEQRNTRS